jgi:hypothetical protein
MYGLKFCLFTFKLEPKLLNTKTIRAITSFKQYLYIKSLFFQIYVRSSLSLHTQITSESLVSV